MRTVVYCERGLDYKYSRIFAGLDVECEVVTTVRFLELAFRKKDANKQYVYHMRYLRWRGYLFTLPMYCLIILVCKIRRIPILFTCHNIVEHTFPSRLCSVCVRKAVSSAANAIIVMHADMKRGLGRFASKTHVACFGDFRDFFENAQPSVPAFRGKYANWLRTRGISRPDIIFVGAYTRYKNVEYLVKFLEEHPGINGLIVSAACPIKTTAENICIFKQKVVTELGSIHRQKGVIGFIAISNTSVATSVYVYANYHIPIIAWNYGPVASLVKKYNIGEVFDSQGDIYDAFLRIRGNYQSYQASMKSFNSENTWAVSRDIHKQVLDRLKKP